VRGTTGECRVKSLRRERISQVHKSRSHFLFIASGDRVEVFGSLQRELPGGGVDERFFGAARKLASLLDPLRTFFGASTAPSGRMGSKAQGAVRGESRGGYWERETSESLNPMDGFDMK